VSDRRSPTHRRIPRPVVEPVILASSLRHHPIDRAVDLLLGEYQAALVGVMSSYRAGWWALGEALRLAYAPRRVQIIDSLRELDRLRAETWPLGGWGAA
jgi:hypothetical protein